MDKPCCSDAAPHMHVELKPQRYYVSWRGDLYGTWCNIRVGPLDRSTANQLMGELKGPLVAGVRMEVAP